MDLDIRTPSDILSEMAKESPLDIEINHGTLKDRQLISVDLKLGQREIRLFKVSHRIDAPYPASISAELDDVPDDLKEERFVPGMTNWGATAAIGLAMAGMRESRWEKNEGICTDANTFDKELVRLLNSSGVKTRITNFIAAAKSLPVTAHDSDKDSGESDEVSTT